MPDNSFFTNHSQERENQNLTKFETFQSRKLSIYIISISKTILKEYSIIKRTLMCPPLTERKES